MTSEEKKIFDGVLFKPGDPELRQIKLRSHNLCAKYNRTTEDEVEYRAQLLEQILGGMGKGVFMPVSYTHLARTRCTSPWEKSARSPRA